MLLFLFSLGASSVTASRCNRTVKTVGTGASFGIQNFDIFKMRRSLLSKVLFFLNCGFFFLLGTFETKAEQTVKIA